MKSETTKTNNINISEKRDDQNLLMTIIIEIGRFDIHLANWMSAREKEQCVTKIDTNMSCDGRKTCSR